MTNIEKAVQVIVQANATRRMQRSDACEIVTVQAAQEYVQALADEGLLAPDPLTDNIRMREELSELLSEFDETIPPSSGDVVRALTRILKGEE